MEMNTNETELMNEHLADKAAAEAVAKAKQEAEWKADRIERNKVEAVARLARNKTRSITLRKIAAAVEAGHITEVVEDDGKLLIDGVDVSCRINFVQEQRQTSSWRSAPTGKTRLTVGDYGDRVSYPQRKDGSHNYAEIANCLTYYATKEIANLKAAQARANNKQVIANLAAELFPNDTSGYQGLVTASSNAAAPVRFKFEIDRSMTVEQARALAAALRSASIKLHYSDDAS